MLYCRNPWRLLWDLGYRGYLRWIPDRPFLKLMFRCNMGHWPNLDQPKTFNEKLQWLKLNFRDDLLTKIVDKYEVRSYVENKIGGNLLVPLLGVWDHFDDIDFDALPNQFVLKCTHDSGGLIVCLDKSKLDKAAARKKINHCLKRNYYKEVFREWPYKNVKPRIIAEQYIADAEGNLPDYKFHCFHGRTALCFIVSGRNEGDPRCDYFDEKGNHVDLIQGYPNADVTPELPAHFAEMMDYADKLTHNLPHCRADFYEVDGKVYFGELTLFDSSGFDKFEPQEWDCKLGDLINLE